MKMWKMWSSVVGGQNTAKIHIYIYFGQMFN